MRQAIHVKYLPPTNHRGSRLKASCVAGKLIKSWESVLSAEDNHELAAIQLANRLNWLTPNESNAKQSFKLLGGVLPDGTYAFILSKS